MCGSLAWQALGAQSCRVNIVQDCAGLWGVTQQSRDLAGLCRPWVGGPVEGRSCMFVSLAWQALRVCTSKAEILQGCADFGSMARRDHKCLWLPGLKGLSHGDPVVLRAGSLG
jgi:hypothetical protein